MRDIGKIINTYSIEDLSKNAAELIVEVGKAAILNKGVFNLALSGGNTPIPLYKLLATAYYKIKLDWNSTNVFFTDERCVSPDHPDSNYGMIKRLLLDHVPVKNVYRMKGEYENPEIAAEEYEQTINEVFELKPDEIPSFDLMLLGIGEDGHVASLFSNNIKSNFKASLVVSNYINNLKASRISLAFNLINCSLNNIYLIHGKSKNEIVCQLANGEGAYYPIYDIEFLETSSKWIITDDE